MRTLRPLLALSFMLALAGCDDDPTPTDAGDADTRDADTRDAGSVDATGPTLVSSLPSDGASAVSPDALLSVRFSEPMAAAGGVTLEADGTALAAPALTRSSDGFAIQLEPAEALPASTEITVVLSGFTDVAGNPLSGMDRFTFSTLDDVRPALVASTPSEGATGVSVDVGTLSFTFSERMDMTRGSVSRDDVTVGEVVWSSLTEASVTVSALAAETALSFDLVDFVDVAGNPLDPAPELVDGALDFTTGADDSAPTVIESDPMEGQLDVSLDGVTRVVVTFSEPMETSSGTATLRVGAGATSLVVSWDDDGRRALLEVGGLLAVDAAHAIDLEGFEDVAGNALDTAPYLVDGALDFTTGDDSFIPFVTLGTPEEGATDVDSGLNALVVVFSEQMDDSRESLEIQDDTGRRITRPVSWGAARTYLTVDLLPGDLINGFDYTIDLRGFADVSGSPIDAAHPYLGDGQLQFSTVATRTGETCRDPLTVAEATETDGVFVWTLADDAFEQESINFSCHPSGGSDDGLIYFRKTGGDLASGGTALRVLVEGADDVVIELFEGSCGTGSDAESARRRCLYRQETWETFLDVAAGDYFLWVSETSGSFGGATVTIEEVAMPTEGESCGAPYDTTSVGVYTAPAGATDPHVWTLPAEAVSSIERTISHDTAPLSCAPEGRFYGRDAVIALEKTSATSVLTVRVEPGAESSASNLLDIAITDTCEAAGATQLGCFASLGDEDVPSAYEVTLRGAAGTRYLWLNTPRTGFSSAPYWRSFPGARVSVTEVETAPGDSCDNAIPITAGASVPITPDRPYRVDAPACTTGAITWYRYTASERLAIVSVANGAAVGGVDAASGLSAGCRDNTVDQSAPVVVAAGDDVCLAVASGAGATTLSVDERPYTGVVGRAIDLAITEPDDAPLLFGTGRFLTLTPTDIYTVVSSRMYAAPRAGGVPYQVVPLSFAVTGDDGLAVGDDLVMFRTSSFDVDNPASLVQRISDVRGAATITAFDSTPSYVDGVPLNAITRLGDTLWVATDTPFGGGTATAFFTLPVGGGAPTPVGSNAAMESVSAIAVDATHVYMMGRVGDTSTGTEGIWRLRRDELSEPSAAPFLVYAGGFNYSDDNGALHVDSAGGTTWIYFRTYIPASVHMVVDPETDTPAYLGTLWQPSGTRIENGLAYDPSEPALYLIDTSVTSDGQWIRIE